MHTTRRDGQTGPVNRLTACCDAIPTAKLALSIACGYTAHPISLAGTPQEIVRTRPLTGRTEMGDWAIIIQGTGIHHNGRDDDADSIMRRFVDELAKSQNLTTTSFVSGSRLEVGTDLRRQS